MAKTKKSDSSNQTNKQTSQKTEGRPKGSPPPSQVRDWYNIIPASFKPKYWNPSIKNHGMNVPFRSIIIGASGGGKTQLILDIIHRFQDTFGLIVLCVKLASEPLYEFLRSKIPPESIEIYENGEIPPIEKYQDEDTQILMICDDLVNEKSCQKEIAEYYIRGRKIAKGISLIYATQMYYAVPKMIRVQYNYIFLKKLMSMRDLTMILKDFSLDLDKFDLLNIYNYATNDPKGFLMVDVDNSKENRFRSGFLDVIKI